MYTRSSAWATSTYHRSVSWGVSIGRYGRNSTGQRRSLAAAAAAILGMQYDNMTVGLKVLSRSQLLPFVGPPTTLCSVVRIGIVYIYRY